VNENIVKCYNQMAIFIESLLYSLYTSDS